MWIMEIKWTILYFNEYFVWNIAVLNANVSDHPDTIIHRTDYTPSQSLKHVKEFLGKCEMPNDPDEIGTKSEMRNAK